MTVIFNFIENHVVEKLKKRLNQRILPMIKINNVSKNIIVQVFT